MQRQKGQELRRAAERETELRAQIAELTREIERITGANGDIAAERRGLEEQLMATEKNLTSAHQEIEDLKKNLANKREASKRNAATAKAELGPLTDKYKRVKQDLEQAMHEIEEVTIARGRIEEQFTTTQNTLVAANEIIDDLRNTNEQMAKWLEILKHEPRQQNPGCPKSLRA